MLTFPVDIKKCLQTEMMFLLNSYKMGFVEKNK